MVIHLFTCHLWLLLCNNNRVWAVVAETSWPTKPKILISWSLIFRKPASLRSSRRKRFLKRDKYIISWGVQSLKKTKAGRAEKECGGELTTLDMPIREDLTGQGAFDPTPEGGQRVNYIDVWVVSGIVGHCEEFYNHCVWHGKSLEEFWAEEWRD